MAKEYRCPACRRIISEEQMKEEVEGGSGGYCYCEFSAVDENGEVWFPRILNIMEALR